MRNRHASIVLGLILGAFLASCGDPFRKITQTPLTTAKDSGIMAHWCLTTFPVPAMDTAERISYILLPQGGVDSADYFRARVEEILRAKGIRDSILLIKYRDTCQSTYDEVGQMFNIGYQAGSFKEKSIAATTMTDYIKSSDKECAFRLSQLQQQQQYKDVEAGTAIRIANADRDNYRGKFEGSRKLNIILLLIICAFLGLTIIKLWLKKKV